MKVKPLRKREDEEWMHLVGDAVTSPADLRLKFGDKMRGLDSVTERFPMRVNSYYLSLIEKAGDSIFRQCIPDSRELSDEGLIDPLEEEEHSPVPGLTHRYPDRVLFLVSSRCAVYCRFCNRRRKVGRPDVVTPETIREGLAYIRANKDIRDVLLSGGDPLLLSDKELFRILTDLRAIPHVEIIRIGSRVPCTLPQRITPGLAEMLKGFHPLYINAHFNHPRELTCEAAAACSRLADAGIPLGCQTVLLKGVNDDPFVMKSLMQGLLKMRAKPYYLFQADLVKGTSHFWTPLERGLEIMNALQGHTSGMCLPHFAVDLPHGGGKVPFLPNYVEEKKDNGLVLRTFEQKRHFYPLFCLGKGDLND